MTIGKRKRVPSHDDNQDDSVGTRAASQEKSYDVPEVLQEVVEVLSKYVYTPVIVIDLLLVFADSGLL